MDVWAWNCYLDAVALLGCGLWDVKDYSLDRVWDVLRFAGNEVEEAGWSDLVSRGAGARVAE